MSPSPWIPRSGATASGSRAVTGSGTASVNHQTTIQRASPTSRQAGSANPHGAGDSHTTTAAAGASHNALRRQGGGVGSVMPDTMVSSSRFDLPRNPTKMTDKSLYEHVLETAGANALPQAKPARPSAAVVPWRRQGDGLEVYWVQRAETLPFMGGWYAFPGGGLSKRDLGVRVTGTPRGFDNPVQVTGLPASLRQGADTPPDVVPGLVACALRELFEETGLLLVRELLPGHGRGPILAASDLDRARRRLLAQEATLGEIVAELKVTLDASPLEFAGRWLTPPLAPLRFDNRFFLLEWPRQASFQPQVVPGELVSGEWIEPARALERWRQGEVLAAPPILHLLTVLAEDGPAAGLPRLLDPSEADLGPYRKIEFRPGVVMLPLETSTLPPATHTNAYLLGHGETVLVDPGSDRPDELIALRAALDDWRGRHGRTVRAIWLTHHHPDHVGGVAAMAQHLGVPVLAHPATARRLRERGLPVDGELEDDQRVTLGGSPAMTVRVVHTPGHARGHLCFFDEEGGALLAGDMVAGISTIVIDPPEGDMDDYLASLERLIALAPTTLFPGHGPAIRDATGKLREYVEHRLWREGKVLEAWRRGERDAESMLPAVYDDAPRAAWPLAARQIEAHLARLGKLGKIP